MWLVARAVSLGLLMPVSAFHITLCGVCVPCPITPHFPVHRTVNPYDVTLHSYIVTAGRFDDMARRWLLLRPRVHAVVRVLALPLLQKRVPGMGWPKKQPDCVRTSMWQQRRKNRQP